MLYLKESDVLSTVISMLSDIEKS